MLVKPSASTSPCRGWKKSGPSLPTTSKSVILISKNLHIVNEGSAAIKVYANIDNLQVELTGDNELDVRGEGNYLNAILSDNAELDAEHFTVKKARVELVKRKLGKNIGNGYALAKGGGQRFDCPAGASDY